MKKVDRRQKLSALASSFRRDQRRGLSPVIATILLIGLVVVSGAIVFTWVRGLTQEAITKFDQNIQLVCGNVEFTGVYSNGNIDVSNTGNIPIYNFKVKILGSSGNYETKDMKSYTGWPDSGINQGGAVSVSTIGISNEQIVLVPVLAGTTSSGTQTSFTCDETQYGKIITS